jgi:DNA primase
MFDLKIKAIIDRTLGESKKVSDEYLYYCPFCHFEKKPKLSVSFTKNKWKCWICLKSGTQFLYLIKKFGKQEDLKEYISFFTPNSSDCIWTILYPDSHKQEDFDPVCTIPKDYEFIYYCNSSASKRALNYLIKDRGLTEKNIYDFRIGFCESGEYRNRFIIPSFNETGSCNYFIAQLPENKCQYKWLYPKIEKSLIIFNELNIDWTKPIYIVEGGIDAIKISNFTMNVVPLIGKTISLSENGYSKLLEKLLLFRPEIYLCLDADVEKGEIINRSVQVANLLLEYGLPSTIINPYPYKDFGAIPIQQINDFLKHQSKIESTSDLLIQKIEEFRLNL